MLAPLSPNFVKIGPVVPEIWPSTYVARGAILLCRSLTALVSYPIFCVLVSYTCIVSMLDADHVDTHVGTVQIISAPAGAEIYFRSFCQLSLHKPHVWAKWLCSSRKNWPKQGSSLDSSAFWLRKHPAPQVVDPNGFLGSKVQKCNISAPETAPEIHELRIFWSPLGSRTWS